MNQTTRFLAINGSLLKSQRLLRGMTQLQLAKKAGYSERLIRKAENGGTLDTATIQNLAEALSETKEVVPWKSLVLDNLSVVKFWLDALDSLGPKMISAVTPHLAENFALHCPGKPATLPFRRIFSGHSGFQQWLNVVFAETTRAPASELECFIGADSVMARWMEKIYLRGMLCIPFRISAVFRMRDGLILRIDLDYDRQLAYASRNATRHVAEDDTQCQQRGTT